MPGFIDESDPNAPSQEFDSFPQGEHDVFGIYDFVFKDDEGVPYYKERDGRPYTMVKLALSEGREGPPMSVSAADLALLVAAFAGEAAVSQLPKDRGSVGYLLKAKQLCSLVAGQKPPFKQKAYVGQKGYVRNVTGANLPTTMFFRFAIDDWRNLDGTTDPLQFTKNQNYNQENLRVRFRVVGDMAGQATIYDGATVEVLLENPFAGSAEMTTADGATVVAPRFKKNQNNSQPKSVARIKNLVNVFAPEVNEHEWVSDMTRSPYGTNEAENPIVVIADYIKRQGRVAVGKVKPRQKGAGVVLDLLDFVAIEGAVPSGNPQPVDSRRALKALYATIRDYVPGVFADDGSQFPAFSDNGVSWAKEKLVPVWDGMNLPQPRRLGDLDEQQATDLLGALLQSVFSGPRGNKQAKAPAKNEIF